MCCSILPKRSHCSLYTANYVIILWNNAAKHLMLFPELCVLVMLHQPWLDQILALLFIRYIGCDLLYLHNFMYYLFKLGFHLILSSSSLMNSRIITSLTIWAFLFFCNGWVIWTCSLEVFVGIRMLAHAYVFQNFLF